MKLKNCSCNKTIFSSDIHRFWPMALFYGIILQLISVLPTLNNFYCNSTTLGGNSPDITFARTIEGLNSGGFPALIAAILFAVYVFQYLSKEKESYSIHAFPVTREGLFVSHYCAGFVLLMIPVILSILALCLLGLVFGVTPSGAFAWGFVQFIIEHILFYNLACLVVMLTGNGGMAFLIYIVLNGLFPGLYSLFQALRSLYIYGATDFTSNFFRISRLSPVVFFMRHYEISHYDNMDQVVLALNAKDCIFVLLSLIPSAIMFLFAIYLYKKRNVETTGEFVVFPWAREVFRIVFTICSSLLFTYIMYYILLYNIVNQYSYSAQFPYILVLVIIGTLLFYWLSNVILYRSIRVFKQTSLLRWGILMVIMVVFLIGTNRYTISIDSVKYPYISVRVMEYTTDSDEDDLENSSYNGNYEYYYKISSNKLSDLEQFINDRQNEIQHQPVADRMDSIGRINIDVYSGETTKNNTGGSFSYPITEDNKDIIYQQLDQLGTKEKVLTP